jgi:predicted RND superfamily exporter protein
MSSGRFARFIAAITRLSVARPAAVLALAFAFAASCWTYASGLAIRGDFIELLPTESAAAKRFRSTVDRRGGASSTLIVVVESPDAAKNKALIDAIEARVQRLPRELVSLIEHGPTETRRFYERWRWLFADPGDLELVSCELERARARAMPGYFELDDPCADLRDAREARDRERAAVAARAAPGTDVAPPPPPAAPGESAIVTFDRRAQAELARLDRFPTGYFQSEDGRAFVLVVRSPSGGFGDARGDRLHAAVTRIGSEESARFPGVELGYAGDIPNAIAERAGLVADIVVVSIAAFALIVLVLVTFFRSPFVLVHLGAVAAIGSGVAFAVAMGTYGHLNAATSFLGSLIAGNGINYGMVYLARYRERRAAGDPHEDALLEAAETSRSGTWLASLAASGAYAALLATSFRGFSEFGLIGGVGMLSSWVASFVVMPASITAAERLAARFARARGAAARPAVTVRTPVATLVGRLATEHTGKVALVVALLVGAAAWPLASYLRDPWEYDFAKLRSESSTRRGAGRFSLRANAVLGVRGSPQLLLADDLSQVDAIAQAVRASDARVTRGTFVERVETIWDVLGGTPAQVDEKLRLLGEIREHLDRVMPHLEGTERDAAARWRPPEYLRRLVPEDLPALVRTRFRERDGRDGTAVFVTLDRRISQSRGQNLLRISDLLAGVRGADGQPVPNASRATVFAEMVRSMERDSPRVTLLAFLVVIAVTFIVSRRLSTVASILVALCSGVLLMIGGAAWLDVRLNFLNFVALPLTFGLGVEYSINVYERIQHAAQERRRTAPDGPDLAAEDVAEGVRSVGGVVALCSLTTILGYASLLFADNLALRSFGRIAMSGEVACTLAAVVVLPTMLAARTRIGAALRARRNGRAPAA